MRERLCQSSFALTSDNMSVICIWLWLVGPLWGIGWTCSIGSSVWERQRFSGVHRPQTWVLALHTDLINVLMAPCLLANEQLMRSSPAVRRSTHFEIATAMITSSILHEFGCKRICSTPRLSSHPRMLLMLADAFSFFFFPSLQTYGNCHSALAAGL